jgi:hypothetical protein
MKTTLLKSFEECPSYTLASTESIQVTQIPESLTALRESWGSYMKNLQYFHLSPANINKQRLATTEYINDQVQSNMTLYHLVVTYCPPGKSRNEYRTREYDGFFKQFYMTKFLPSLMKSNNFNRPSKRQYQPICISYLDEHESQITSSRFHKVDHGDFYTTYDYAERLHHHSMILVHPSTLLEMKNLEGTNTLIDKKNSRLIRSTYLQPRDPFVNLYCSKMMFKYYDNTLICH